MVFIQGKLRKRDRLKIYFIIISIIFSLFVSGIPGILITKLIFENLSLFYFWILIPGIIIFNYALFMIVFLILSVMFYKLFLPIPDGKYDCHTYEYYINGARGIYLRIFLGFLFPFPVLRTIPQLYNLFGAKMGKGSYIAYPFTEPDRVETGVNCMIGELAVVTSHTYAGNKLILKKIKIGNNVTIGAGAVVFPGVEIGDNCIIGANTIVPKNEKIPTNTIWLGPDRKPLKRKSK